MLHEVLTRTPFERLQKVLDIHVETSYNVHMTTTKQQPAPSTDYAVGDVLYFVDSEGYGQHGTVLNKQHGILQGQPGFEAQLDDGSVVYGLECQILVVI